MATSGPVVPGSDRPAGDVRRLQIRPRSIVAGVLALVATIVVLRVAEASTRVLGWVLAATVLAGVLHPAVALLSRRLPRPAALAVVTVGLLAVVGALAYGVVDELRTEVTNLQDILPDAAAELEDSRRFGEAAREFRLTERTQAFVDELPGWLQGGSGAEALRTNATRGVAFLATGVLTLFLLVHGPRLLTGGLAQVASQDRRDQLAAVLLGAYERTGRYLWGTLAKGAVVGVVAWILLRLADVPGERVLALTIAVTSALPCMGVLIGALPSVMVAFGVLPIERALAVTVLVVGLQAAEYLLLQRWVDRRSIHVGPTVTILVVVVGLGLYGFGGVVVGLAFAVFAVSVVDDVAPTDEHVLRLDVDALVLPDVEPLDGTDGAATAHR